MKEENKVIRVVSSEMNQIQMAKVREQLNNQKGFLGELEKSIASLVDSLKNEPRTNKTKGVTNARSRNESTVKS